MVVMMVMVILMTPVCIIAVTYMRFPMWISCNACSLIVQVTQQKLREVLNFLSLCFQHPWVLSLPDHCPLFSFPFFLNPFPGWHSFASGLVSCSCREIIGLVVKLNILPQVMVVGSWGHWWYHLLKLSLPPCPAGKEWTTHLILVSGWPFSPSVGRFGSPRQPKKT